MHPNETLIRDYLQAWEDGDAARAESYYASDFVMHQFGRNPLSGSFQGIAAHQQWLEKLYGILGDEGKAEVAEVIDILANDRRAVCLFRMHFEKPGKAPLEVDRTSVFDIVDGKIQVVRVLDDDQHAVDEFFSRA